MLALNDGELIYREPVVVVRFVEIDQPHLDAANRTVVAPLLDRYALG